MKYLDNRNIQVILIIGSCFIVVALADDDEDSFTSRLNETLFSHYNTNNLNSNSDGVGKAPNFPRYDNRPARPQGGQISERNQISAVLWARQRPRDGCVKKIKILNGVAVFRRRGSIVKFICSQGFSLLGATIAVCLSGRWSEPPPICVKSGCTSVRQPLNGGAMFHMDGAVVSFHCDWNFELVGNSVLYCDGIRWNGTEPACNPLHEEPIMTTTTHNPNADWDYVTESGQVQQVSSEDSQGISTTNQGGGEAWDENIEVTTAVATMTRLPEVPPYSTPTPKLSISEKSTNTNVPENADDHFDLNGSIYPSTSTQASDSVTQDQNAWDNSISIVERQSSAVTVSSSTELTERTNEATSTTPARFQVTSEESPSTTIGLAVKVSTDVSSTIKDVVDVISTIKPSIPESPSVVTTTPTTTATSSTPRSSGRRTKAPSRYPSGSGSIWPRPYNPYRPYRPTGRPFLRPRTKSTKSPRTTRKMTSSQPEDPTSALIPVTIPPIVETQLDTTTTMISDTYHRNIDDEGILYNPVHQPEFIQPISPHKLDIDSTKQVYESHTISIRLAHISMVGGILLAVIGSVFLVGGVAMYCWRKNKGIARARSSDIDGRTLSASDAMEDFTWMEAREYRH